jgi:hypothetical protein
MKETQGLTGSGTDMAKVFDFATWQRARGKQQDAPADDGVLQKESMEARLQRSKESIERLINLCKELKGVSKPTEGGR